MENHGDREEVEIAEEDGTGFSTRYSKTMDEKTINYAIQLTDETILRVSSEYDTLLHIVLGMIQPIVVIVVIALILRRFWRTGCLKELSNLLMKLIWSIRRMRKLMKSWRRFCGKLSIRISRLKIRCRSLPDSRWNLLQLLKI